MPEHKRADREIIKQARILWDYLKLDQPLRKADCVIAMGSHDLRVGEYAAQLIIDGWAPLLVCSGGLGRLTRGIWNESEGYKFAQAALEAGIAEERILIEGRSSNTAENLRFSRELLEEKGFFIHSAILVHKPYMERRTLATAGIAWPELNCIITSPPITFKEYPTNEIPLELVIDIMVGDFQRIIVYAEKGYQTRQEVQQSVMSAFENLIARGFDQYLIH